MVDFEPRQTCLFNGNKQRNEQVVKRQEKSVCCVNEFIRTNEEKRSCQGC